MPVPVTRKATDRDVQKTVLAKRDRIVLEHMPLVKAIAARVRENLPAHVEVEDLVHAGIIGLFEAAEKYESEKHVAFGVYARHRIRGAILDSLRKSDWASRDLRRRQKELQEATHHLTGVLNRTPTDIEIAQHLGVDISRCRELMMNLQACGLLSSDSGLQFDDDGRAAEFPGASSNRPDTICAVQQRAALLESAMQVLSERHQKVVTMYYTQDMSMKEIGGALGINESRVSQLHKSALLKLNDALHGAGIFSSTDV